MTRTEFDAYCAGLPATNVHVSFAPAFDRKPHARDAEIDATWNRRLAAGAGNCGRGFVHMSSLERCKNAQSLYGMKTLQLECLTLANIGFDTAENEPFKVCPLSVHRSPR